MKNVAEVSQPLRPFDARQMRSYAVSDRVNPVANDDEECSRPVERREEQGGLFANLEIHRGEQLAKMLILPSILYTLLRLATPPICSIIPLPQFRGGYPILHST